MFVTYQSFTRARRLIVIVLAVLAATSVIDASRQQSVKPALKIDLERLGPQVGARLPHFTLRDQRGETRTLKSLMGPRGAMIVFFRSADW
ncbi:MAG TPA: hypothetical protein VHU82_14830 [Vicinamibacterales bacterium]|nr:hypothetical protein [Vicinamibacterales bacterium]